MMKTKYDSPVAMPTVNVEELEEYSKQGHLLLRCAGCDRNLQCYTQDPYVAVNCPSCEERDE